MRSNGAAAAPAMGVVAVGAIGVVAAAAAAAAAGETGVSGRGILDGRRGVVAEGERRMEEAKVDWGVV